MDKQYVVYIFTGVLSALKRKKILHMKTMLSEIMQPLKKKKKKASDSTYMSANKQKKNQKGEWWVPDIGGMGEWQVV